MVWPDLTRDEAALEAAKNLINWSDMTPEEQAAATSYLLKLAQEFKEML